VTASPLFDPGLQPERTSLAWRRTALSVAVGSLVALRVLPESLHHPIWYVPGFLGVLFAAWLWRVSHRRYQYFVEHTLQTERRPVAPGSGALLATSVIVSLLAVVAGMLVAYQAFR
jgi:uncharacterized membrane protein YidH (DUF202 family)